MVQIIKQVSKKKRFISKYAIEKFTNFKDIDFSDYTDPLSHSYLSHYDLEDQKEEEEDEEIQEEPLIDLHSFLFTNLNRKNKFSDSFCDSHPIFDRFCFPLFFKCIVSLPERVSYSSKWISALLLLGLPKTVTKSTHVTEEKGETKEERDFYVCMKSFIGKYKMERDLDKIGNIKYQGYSLKAISSLFFVLDLSINPREHKTDLRSVLKRKLKENLQRFNSFVEEINQAPVFVLTFLSASSHSKIGEKEIKEVLDLENLLQKKFISSYELFFFESSYSPKNLEMIEQVLHLATFHSNPQPQFRSLTFGKLLSLFLEKRNKLLIEESEELFSFDNPKRLTYHSVNFFVDNFNDSIDDLILLVANLKNRFISWPPVEFTVLLESDESLFPPLDWNHKSKIEEYLDFLKKVKLDSLPDQFSDVHSSILTRHVWEHSVSKLLLEWLKGFQIKEDSKLLLRENFKFFCDIHSNKNFVPWNLLFEIVYERVLNHFESEFQYYFGNKLFFVETRFWDLYSNIVPSSPTFEMKENYKLTSYTHHYGVPVDPFGQLKEEISFNQMGLLYSNNSVLNLPEKKRSLQENDSPLNSKRPKNEKIDLLSPFQEDSPKNKKEKIENNESLIEKYQRELNKFKKESKDELSESILKSNSFFNSTFF